MIEGFIGNILKDSFAPIIVEFFISNGLKIWEYNKLSAIVFFIAGFLFTKFGNLIILILGIVIFYLKKR